MPKIVAAFLVAALLVGPTVVAQSQQPPIGARKVASQQQRKGANETQKATADQRGTEPSPLVVKIKTTREADQEAAYAASYAKQEAADNRNLLIVTCVLAFLAALQWIAMFFQAVFMRRTAESFVCGERPHVFMGRAEGAFFSPAEARYIETAGNTAEAPKVTWTFRNLGRTTAIVEEIRAELFFGTTLPPRRKYIFSEPTVGQTILPSEKDSSPFTTAFDRVISKGEIKEILASQKDFFLFGHIIYTDAFSHRHTYNFAFRVIQNRHTGGILMIEGGKEYNGTKSKKT